MGTKALVFYLLSAFSVAVFSVFLVTHYQQQHHQFTHISSLNSALSDTQKVWPKLEFGWRIAVASLIGFLGSAFGTVGGVGGGGIFVPMLTLIVGFDTKSAAALSKCMIMAASASSVWYNLRVQHPTKDVPILDYDLALLFQPMLMLGTSSRSFCRGIMMWKEETLLNKELAKRQDTFSNSRGELLIDTEYEPLCPQEEKSPMQVMCSNLKWKRLLLLMIVWVSFVLLQVVKNDIGACTTWYWVLNLIQFPVAFGVFGYEAIKLCKEGRKRKIAGNTETVCEASIEFTPLTLCFCALCGLLGGTVGGLLGSGGGFILGPLLLEIGVIPQVASATATFVMLFSSSLSVVEFYILKRFPITYALYLMSVSLMAGFWGQYFVRKLVAFLKRASLIIFILSGVIFASALTMGVIGIEKSIQMINNHEFMGFLDFCSSQ
ncbi:sulfite exporter TauE/SafE family protein 4 isoform X2 [Beta vulgaris subsp. vulgaris]|uniref:sulfite exporter TauE/SafE family protein 4 isoform X2 n=1 Tax=Beta vulgaris subsp. vulgaris TaxID=3555 RepID=UPI002036B73E|nr:sulfite exporter TauE/SafE family protein 4 isoform X2 [Beta vulgaris subsp. vulgaris]